MKTLNKFTISVIGTTLVFLAACGGGGNTIDDKKAQLEKLKAQSADISSQIKTLEEEIKNAGVSLTENEKSVNVSVTSIQPASFAHYIDVQGRVDGDENINLMPKGQGPVTRIYVKAGSVVKKDQVLAELYNDVQAAQLASVKPQLNLATEVYNRQKSLWDKGIGSEVQYLQAKAQKEALEKQVATLEETVDMTKIKSPISGTIDDVMLKVGQMASPMMPAFRIVNFDKLKVKADIAETYANRIREGNDVLLEFPDINKSLKAKVTFSGKSINQLNRTFSIEVQLPNDASFIPNMISLVKVIDYSKTNTIVVPVNCIQTIDGKSQVFVAVTEKGKKVAHLREVKVGMTYNDSAEILSGLTPGEQLITVGYADLNDGEIIKF